MRPSCRGRGANGEIERSCTFAYSLGPMTRVENPPLKTFLNQHCNISYRQQRRSAWSNESPSGYTVIFVLGGTLKYQTGSNTIELPAGNFLLANPGTSSQSRTWLGPVVSLAITPSFLVDCAIRTGLGTSTNDISLLAETALKDSGMTRLIDDLAREMLDAEPGHEVVIAAVVEQIVIHLLRHYATFRQTASLELSRVGLVDRRIRRAIELMVAQLDQELSLRDLAAASYLSPFHFSRLFKKLMGTTPHAYLASLRTTTAQRLLAETDLPITAVSARVGYSSPSHFSRGFRQATGLSPRAFRASLISRPTR